MTDKRTIHTHHVYEGAPGALFTATLTIHDAVYGDLTDPPAGMTIDPSSGVVTWEPAAPDVGTHAVVVTADDGNGHVTVQGYSLEVLACGSAPEFLTAPGGFAGFSLHHTSEPQASACADIRAG